ncbi:MAG: hypothetical protein WCG67_02845, partial [Ferruginibacter sp.]
TIDTPVKVAHFGISSVISIVEDSLLEDMRKYYCGLYQLPYTAIAIADSDYRAKRTTAYLNVINEVVKLKMATLKEQPFQLGNDIMKYILLLPDESPLKLLYQKMESAKTDEEKATFEKELRNNIGAGAIDVNIMSKVDKDNFAKDGSVMPLGSSDALASLRGFAESDLHSSVIFSAGYNPRLYAYLEHFADFYPNKNNYLKKKVILKVSDYRSAVTQGKLLAKKGIWVSEFRIESGLNCGGHAFATDGLLLGPIMEMFKLNRAALALELYTICNEVLATKGKNTFISIPDLRITVQGGIGNSNENNFLLKHYLANGTGWGSPFLLVPEATNVDKETLHQLATAQPEDYYLSHASPLGIPFNNFRKSSSEKQKFNRIENGKPGSPCSLKMLLSNTEFTKHPICTASRQYQRLKIAQLKNEALPKADFEEQYDKITEKVCLCTGLGASALLNSHIEPKHHIKTVAICPGPNLAFFSGIFSLQQMVDHIYGRTNILNSLERPNLFVNELKLYVDYLKKEITTNLHSLNNNKIRYFKTFQTNLLEGVNYYKKLKAGVSADVTKYIADMSTELNNWEHTINNLFIPAAL